MDKFNEAVSDFENAKNRNEQQNVVSAIERLSTLYDQIDELELVDALCFQLIDMNKMMYGEGSPEYGNALCRYAACKIRRRDNQAADKYLRLGEPLIKSKLGVKHPFYGTVMQTKATLHYVNNRMQEAIKCYQEAENIYRDALIAASKENFLKYRSGFVANLAMKHYVRFFAGVPSENFDSDFALIESLYSADGDEMELSDALMLKATVELKSRKLFAARHDTEHTLNILRKNFDEMKIFKSINTAMQLANILQLLSDYQNADIIIDQEIKDINAEPRLDQYGALGSLYMMKANGLAQFNINPDDLEYYSGKAMDLLGKEEYLRKQYISSKFYHAMALRRKERLEEASKEFWDCFEAIKGSVNTIEDLEKKYLYWTQYAMTESLISPDNALRIFAEIDQSFTRECQPFSRQQQFASLRLSFLGGLAGTHQSIYAENKDEKNFLMAKSAWMKTMDIYPEARPYDDPRRDHGSIARLYAMHGDKDEALKYSENFYNYWSSSFIGTLANMPPGDRERLQNNISSFFQTTLPLLIGNKTNGKEVNLLLNSSLFSRSILLATEMQMANIVKKAEDPKLDKLYSDYLKARGNLSGDNPSSRRDLQTAETALIRHPMVSKYMTDLNCVDWRQIRDALGVDDAAVEFIQTIPISGDQTGEYLAVVIRHDKAPELVHLPDISNIRLNHDFDLNSLEHIVWKPLEKELKGVNRLYFTPSGILHSLPVENFSGVASRSNRRLTTLAEILRKNDRKSGFSGGAALFGGLEYDAVPDTMQKSLRSDHNMATQRSVELHQRSGVRFLPASLTEINSIRKTLDAGNIPVRLYTGSKGSEEQFKALSGKNLSILHFATHGFYYSSDKTASASRSLRKMFSDGTGLSDSDRAMFRSGLFMSGANHKLKGSPLPPPWEDGVLTAMEISTTDLYGTSLAVLSACQSGMGDISSEGVFGMPRALKKAGVQTIVMSLWKVDDEATSILMDNFYKSYSGGKSASESLAIAQNILRKDSRFENPYFWSAFVVLDDINRNK